jgi:uncharacterized protein with GYD domain
MPTYITLVRYTREGITKIKDSPARLEKVKEVFKGVGGEMKAFYLTMGQYDLVVIGEFPNDEAIAKAVLTAGSAGTISTETLRAFTEEEYRQIIAGLP